MNRLCMSSLALGLVWVTAQEGWAAKQTPPDSPVSPTNYGYIVLSDASFHEDVPIVGTPFVLHYSSRRTRGYMPAYDLVVWYADPNTFPTNLSSVDLTVTIAGRVFRHSQAAPFTNYYWNLLWDGRDAQSNLVYGTTPAVVDSTATFLDYMTLDEYEDVSGNKYDSGLFLISGSGSGNALGGPLWPVLNQGAITVRESLDRSPLYSIRGQTELYSENELRRLPIIPWYTSRKKRDVSYLGALPASSEGLGGWTINLNHSYDGKSGYLHEGKGSDRKVTPVGYAECSFSVTNAPPTNEFAAVATDGSEYYVLDPNGRHLRTVDALTGAELYTFVYDTNSLLTEVVDANSLTTRLVRATNGQVTAIIGPFGLKTDLVISNGWLCGLVNPAGETNLFRYSDAGLLTNIVSRRGFIYTVIYDAEGKAIRAEDPAGGFDAVSLVNGYNRKTIVHTYSLNRTNRYTSSTAWNGDRIDEAINVAGAVTRTRTSSDGLASEVTSPNGMVALTRSVADPRFGSSVMIATQVMVRTPAGLTNDIRIGRSYSLLIPTNPASQLLGFTNQIIVNGRTSQVVFSSVDRTLRRTSPMGKTLEVEFDSQWRPVQWKRPGIAPVTADYDAYGRLDKIQQSNRVAYLAYATSGFWAAFTNALDESVLLRADAIGRVTNIVLPDSSVIGLRPQPTTGPIGVTPPGRSEHTLGYTSVGLLERYSSPVVSGPTNMFFTWDEARHLTSVSYPDGRAITNEYNPAGFLIGVQWPENRVTNAYACDCGQLGGIYATNGTSLTFGYDGGLLTNVVISGVITGSVSYSYNNDIRVAGIGFGGNVASYGYDLDGLLTNAGALTLYRDAAFGWVTNATVGNVGDQRAYNAFGEMNSYEAVFDNDSIYYGVDYSYDKLGRITNRLERIEGITNRYAYTYDSVGRLHEVYTNGTLRARYGYDANGNRTSSWIAGSARIYQYDAQDRLTASFWNLVQYQYNANGQMTNMYGAVPTRATRYDTRGSLMEVRVGTNAYEYLLDPLGRRVGKKVNGFLSRGWIYQGFLTPAAEINSDNQVVARFVYATRVNVPDYMVKTGRTFRIIADHLGSVRLVVDVQNGVIAQRLDYDEWGNVTSDTNPGFQPFGFAGGLYDSDTGLVRFGYRDYDPTVGRWLSKDPILFGAGANFYQYCTGNPIDFVDPYGLCEEQHWYIELMSDTNFAYGVQNASSGPALIDALLGPGHEPEGVGDIIVSVVTVAERFMGLILPFVSAAEKGLYRVGSLLLRYVVTLRGDTCHPPPPEPPPPEPKRV